MPLHSPRIDNWLNLSMLRVLVGVADRGSLSASARAAGIAQSNASRSLKTLERRVGYTLLHRSTRGSTLSREGMLTVEWAREVLEALDRLSAGTEALARCGPEELTIGASMTIAEHLLPGWLGSFRSQHPESATKLQVMNSAQVIETVDTGEVALGFVETPDIPSSLRSTQVWVDELVAVVSPTHPWAYGQRSLTIEELAITPLVEREEGSGTRAFLDLLVGEHRPPPVLELNSNSAICQTVIEGIAPAILSRLAVEGYLRTGELVEIPTRSQGLSRTLHAIWKSDASLTATTKEFIEISRVGYGR